METKPFSFAGFSAQIPSDWDVSTIKIEEDETVIGIRDLVKGRLEVTWQSAGWKKVKEEARKKNRSPEKKLLDPESVAKNYHEKAMKKVKGLVFLDEVRKEKVNGHAAVISEWTQGDEEGYEAIWYCGVSDRYYYLRYVDGDNSDTFEQILKSVVCHSSLSYTKWQYLGLDLRLPNDYHITEQKAEVGKITVVFTGHWPERQRKKGAISWLRPQPLPEPRRFIVTRWNMIRYGNNELKSWCQNQAVSLIKKYVGESRKVSEGNAVVNGHQAVFQVYSIGGGLLRKPSGYSVVYAWICPQSKSAYLAVNPLVQGAKLDIPEEQIAKGMDYVRCHVEPLASTESGEG